MNLQGYTGNYRHWPLAYPVYIATTQRLSDEKTDGAEKIPFGFQPTAKETDEPAAAPRQEVPCDNPLWLNEILGPDA